MNFIAQWRLQEGVYQVLSLNSDLLQLCIGGIHDGSVPPNDRAAWPYIVIDSFTEVPDDRVNAIGRICTFAVHVHSQQLGTKEGATVANLVAGLLNRRHFTMIDWNMTSCELVNVNSFLETSENRHTVLRFKVKCQPLS